MKKSHMIAITTLTTASALILGVAAYAQGHGQGPMGGPGERPAFATLDADGDGNITIAEMKAHAETQFGERDPMATACCHRTNWWPALQQGLLNVPLRTSIA